MHIKSIINSLLRPTSRMLANQLLVKRNEVDVFSAQKSLLKATTVRTVFDLGAHIGKTAQNFRKIFPDATVYCFEPTETTFLRLNERTSSDKHIIRHKMAVSDRPGPLAFHYNTQASTNSILKSSAEAGLYWNEAQMHTERVATVQATTLDKFCEEERIAHIDVLKMDIQGGELLALKGADGLLRAKKIRLICMEVIFVPTYEGQPQVHEIMAWLKDRGYTLHNFYRLASKNGRLLYGDAIFLGT